MKARLVAVSLGILCSIILASLWHTVATSSVGVQTSVYPEVATLKKMVTEASAFALYDEFFSQVAKEKGAEYAFELMKVGPLPFGLDTHLLGHTVGDMLYEQKGVSGMASCTHDFRNACSHTIVIGTLLEFGIGAAKEIRTACESAPGGTGAYTMCFHGLGHGVLAFNGYNIEKTAEMCRTFGTTLHQHAEAEQCFGGAVMEIIGGGGHDREEWEKRRAEYLRRSDPLALCSQSYLTHGERLFCYLYITPYLLEATGADVGRPTEDDFVRVFLLCDTLSETEPQLRQACFEGLGKEFIGIVAGRNFADGVAIDADGYVRLHDWCTLAKAEDGIIACERSVVDSLFWGGENDLAIAQAFCDTTELGLQRNCYEALIKNIDQYVPDLAYRQAACNAFLSEVRGQCEEMLLGQSYEIH